MSGSKNSFSNIFFGLGSPRTRFFEDFSENHDFGEKIMKFSKNRKCKDYTCAIIPKHFFGENIGSGDQKHAFTTYIRDILG